MNTKIHFLKRLYFYNRFKYSTYHLFYYPVKALWYFITSLLVMIFLLTSCSLETKVIVDKKLKISTATESNTTIITEPLSESTINTILKSTPPLITSITDLTQSIIFYKSSTAYSDSTFTLSCNDDGYINIINTNTDAIV